MVGLLGGAASHRPPVHGLSTTAIMKITEFTRVKLTTKTQTISTNQPAKYGFSGSSLEIADLCRSLVVSFLAPTDGRRTSLTLTVYFKPIVA